jgi:thiol-disulfide isomerase/thioredoxin
MGTRKKSSGFKRKMKTARKYRISTAGKILPPLDVRSNKDLDGFKKRIQKGPLTIVLVYADWCGHCHTMMPHFDEAAKSGERSIQAVKINEQMLPSVNSYVNKNVNKSAQSINVEGYPSMLLIDTKANKVADVPTKRDTNVMTSLMEKSGSIAKEAGLNGSNPEEAVNSIVTNNIVSPASNVKNNSNKNKKKNNLMAEFGVEESGLAAEAPASPRNFDVGEEELKGSLSPSAPINQLSRSNSNNNATTSSLKKLNIATSMAPSPTTGFSAEYEDEPNRASARKNSNKSMEEEARIVTSLAAPLSPPLNDGDIEGSLGANGLPESISNSLEPAEKVSGGGCGCGGPAVPRYGGSLMGTLARTTYTLAPAAALLATAAMVMRGKTRKHKKSAKKTRRNRRNRRR